MDGEVDMKPGEAVLRGFQAEQTGLGETAESLAGRQQMDSSTMTHQGDPGGSPAWGADGQGPGTRRGLRQAALPTKSNTLSAPNPPLSPALPPPLPLNVPCKTEKIEDVIASIGNADSPLDAAVAEFTQTVKAGHMFDGSPSPCNSLLCEVSSGQEEYSDSETLADWEVDRQEWRQHRRLMYSLILSKVFSCARCKKEYRSRLHLSQHMQTVHGEALDKEKAASMQRTRTKPSPKGRGSAGSRSLTKKGAEGGSVGPTWVGEKVDLSAWVVKSRGKYKCLQCHKRFAYHGGAQRHILLSDCSSQPTSPKDQPADPQQRELCPGTDTGTRNKLDCQECGATFALGHHLQKHVESSHVSQPKYMCPQCQVSFTQVSRLQLHISVVHKKVGYSCSQCSNVFASRAQLRRHMLSTHRRWTKKPCLHCGKVYSRSIDLRTHIENLHGSTLTEPSSLNSKVSSGATQTQDRSHLGNEKSTKQKPHAENRVMEADKTGYPCPHCTRHFTDQAVYEQHVRIAHCQKPGHSCPRCGRKYARASSLASHIINDHRGLSDQNCLRCGKVFANHNGLLHHLQIVHKVISHKCALCGETFSKLPLLCKHMKLIHQKTSSFVCLECGRSYSRKYHLEEHINSIHKKMGNSCHVCGKTFSRRDNLQKHLRVIHKIKVTRKKPGPAPKSSSA